MFAESTTRTITVTSDDYFRSGARVVLRDDIMTMREDIGGLVSRTTLECMRLSTFLIAVSSLALLNSSGACPDVSLLPTWTWTADLTNEREPCRQLKLLLRIDLDEEVCSPTCIPMVLLLILAREKFSVPGRRE